MKKTFICRAPQPLTVSVLQKKHFVFTYLFLNINYIINYILLSRRQKIVPELKHCDFPVFSRKLKLIKKIKNLFYVLLLLRLFQEKSG